MKDRQIRHNSFDDVFNNVNELQKQFAFSLQSAQRRWKCRYQG